MPVCSCRFCDSKFEVRPYRALTARFCSRSCLAKAQLDAIQVPRLAAIRGKKPKNWANVNAHCQQCESKFQISPSRKASKRFCSQNCYSAAQRTTNATRYKRITVSGKRYLEHRWIMEQHLGRLLLSSEEVDHINRNKRDNRLENLRLVSKQKHGAISSKSRGSWYQLILDGYR